MTKIEELKKQRSGIARILNDLEKEREYVLREIEHHTETYYKLDKRIFLIENEITQIPQVGRGRPRQKTIAHDALEVALGLLPEASREMVKNKLGL